jgi:hypothetical protein
MNRFSLQMQWRLLLCMAIGSLIVLSLSPQAQAQTGNIDSTDKYAWSENAGWLNFGPTNGGVTVYADHLEGFAWAENIGWVKLGSYTSGGTHTYTNTSAADYGVNNTNGVLSGYAWSETAGWINFSPTHGGVTIGADGRFDGYAWAENVGWVHFQNVSPAYNIRQTLITISGNAGVAGATLSYSDGTAKTAIAEDNGDYNFTVSYNWSGTVTPFKTDYIFEPASRAYTNVTVNQTAQDYTATPIIPPIEPTKENPIPEPTTLILFVGGLLGLLGLAARNRKARK